MTRKFIYDETAGRVVEVVQVPQRKNRAAKYGYFSHAMAINPEDVPRAQALAQQHGHAVHYSPTGEPLIESKQHQLKHMDVFGFYDRNAGYSGAPKNR